MPGVTGRLLVATTNPGKLAEIRDILAGTGVEVVSLGDLAPIPEPEESGATFGDNARRKATAYSLAAGLPTVAEDSGLEIDALDGAPGVRSARFPGATYPERFALIYRLLEERGALGSAARFVCALSLADRHDVLFEARGVVEGRIAPEPCGTGGFGYDPIFFFPPLGRTLAEIDARDKAGVSHRGQAFRALRAFLEAHPGALRPNVRLP